MKFYRIGEFARIIGVTSVTLRNWERTGLLVPHHRSPSGYRYYSHEQAEEYLRGGVDNGRSGKVQRDF